MFFVVCDHAEVRAMASVTALWAGIESRPAVFVDRTSELTSTRLSEGTSRGPPCCPPDDLYLSSTFDRSAR